MPTIFWHLVFRLFTFPLLLLQSLQNPKILLLLPLPLLPYYFANKYFAADITTIKCTSVTFWAERIFFLSCLWHFYDDNCDKTRYHHRCGGLLLLWQKIMTENGLFVLGGPETQLWAVHDGKNRGRSEGEENIGVFPVTVGGRGRALRVSLVHARAWVRDVGL